MRVFVTLLYDLGREYQTQVEILDLCLASFRKNLDADEFVTFRGTILSGAGSAEAVRNWRYSEMLIDAWQQLRDLWSSGVDILFADGDTLCVKPTPWPDGDGMRMFNLACCKVLDRAYSRRSYLHSGVKLFPQSMDPKIWDVGQRIFDAYDRNTWAYDQLVWNRMFWAQDGLELKRAREYVDPRYCWVPLREFNNLGVSRSKAYIVHYGETRGMKMCLKRMRRDAR